MKDKVVQKPSEDLERLLTLKRRVELMKNTYEEIDQLTVQLAKKNGIPRLVEFRGKVKELELVDNYKEKNSAWGHAAVRRFEVKIKDHKDKKKVG